MFGCNSVLLAIDNRVIQAWLHVCQAFAVLFVKGFRAFRNLLNGGFPLQGLYDQSGVLFRGAVLVSRSIPSFLEHEACKLGTDRLQTN